MIAKTLWDRPFRVSSGILIVKAVGAAARPLAWRGACSNGASSGARIARPSECLEVCRLEWKVIACLVSWDVCSLICSIRLQSRLSGEGELVLSNSISMTNVSLISSYHQSLSWFDDTRARVLGRLLSYTCALYLKSKPQKPKPYNSLWCSILFFSIPCHAEANCCRKLYSVFGKRWKAIFCFDVCVLHLSMRCALMCRAR